MFFDRLQRKLHLKLDKIWRYPAIIINLPISASINAITSMKNKLILFLSVCVKQNLIKVILPSICRSAGCSAFTVLSEICKWRYLNRILKLRLFYANILCVVIWEQYIVSAHHCYMLVCICGWHYSMKGQPSPRLPEEPKLLIYYSVPSVSKATTPV